MILDQPTPEPHYNVVDAKGHHLASCVEPADAIYLMRHTAGAWAVDRDDGVRIAYVPGARRLEVKVKPALGDGPRRQPKVGECWRWRTPTGEWREMLIRHIQEGPGLPRAYGTHPDGGGKLQCGLGILRTGKNEAEFVRTVEGFEYESSRGPRPNTGKWWATQERNGYGCTR